MSNERQLIWDGTNNVTPVEVSISHASVKFPFILRNHTSDIPTFSQVCVNLEYAFNVKKPPEVIIDAGANIGLASIYLASRYPEAKIVAVEPEESNFQMLKKNTAPYENITPVQAALWNENGTINLVDPGLGHWGFMTNDEDSLGTHRHDVRSMTVDKIMNEYGFDKVDILKIDIEGAEKEVFSNTSAWLDKVTSLIIELHEDMKVGCHRSFYNGSNGFDEEWLQGENVYLVRDQFLVKSLS